MSAWIAVATLSIAIGAVYLPHLNAPFIFDDVDTVTRNESIKTLWPLFGTESKPGPLKPAPNIPTSARPLVNLSFAINYKFSGDNPVGYHAVNVVLHFLSAMLLWAITRRALRLPYFGGRFDSAADAIPLAVALIWSLHPLQTETVIYATQRTELMMAFFYLATLYCSVRYWCYLPLPLGEGRGEGALKIPLGEGRGEGALKIPLGEGRGEGALKIVEHKSRRTLCHILAIVACLAGMASKEVMVSAPLVVLLYDRTFISGSLKQALRNSWPLYIGLSATWILLLALTVGNPHSGAAGFALGPPAYVWWYTQAKIFWIYLKLAIWPWPLFLHYHLPYLDSFSAAWPYVISLLVVGLATLVLLWKKHAVGFLATCVFAILAPTSVIPIITEMAAERRMYLPLAAIVPLFVVGGWRLALAIRPNLAKRTEAKRAFMFVLVPALILAITCAVASARRLSEYHDEFGLWKDVLQSQPQNPIAHHSVGYIYDKAGDSNTALAHFREEVRLDPGSSKAHNALAVVLAKTGAYAEAAAEFAEADRITPNNELLRINLAAAWSLAGQYDKSIEVSRETLKTFPDSWAVYNNLANALQKAGQFDEAVVQFEQALKLNPSALTLYNDIADIHIERGKPDEASAALKKGLEQATARGDTAMVERFTKRLNQNPK